MHLDFRRVDWPFASIFRIAYEVSTQAETVMVELRDGTLVGRGEAMGVSYHGETVDSILTQLESFKSQSIDGLSRSALLELLPPGGARNALDCALWDLEAKRTGHRAWEIAGVPSVRPLITAYTLSLDTPRVMSEAAAAAERYSVFKLKLAGDEDRERVTGIRKARPDAQIIVDANQAWSERQLLELVPVMAELGVQLIEQPMAVGKDEVLREFRSPVPLCADESCQTVDSLASLVGKYEYVNIKLDKTGGLTEALRLTHAARALDFKLMVGCMGGSSLAMAPAFIVGQFCEVVDLDGPLLSKSDIANGIHYEGSRMLAPEASLWG